MHSLQVRRKLLTGFTRTDIPTASPIMTRPVISMARLTAGAINAHPSSKQDRKQKEPTSRSVSKACKNSGLWHQQSKRRYFKSRKVCCSSDEYVNLRVATSRSDSFCCAVSKLWLTTLITFRPWRHPVCLLPCLLHGLQHHYLLIVMQSNHSWAALWSNFQHTGEVLAFQVFIRVHES